MMKNIKSTILIFMAFVCQLQAQIYSGVAESHYAGYLGLNVNPANVVTPYFRADVNLLSYNLSLVNDYASLKLDSLNNGTGDFFDRLTYKNNGNDEANIGFNGEVNWLGALISINDKMGISLGIKTKFLLNARGINKDLIEMSASGLEDSTFYGKSYQDDYTSISGMAWNEYSVAFGAEVFKKDNHYIKVGGALKLLQSIGSFYVHAKDISYEFYNTDTILKASGQISFGGNADILDAFNGKDMPNFNPFSGGSFGFGADFGAIYEYRPDGDKKYKLKAGLSFHDVGFIAFQKDHTSSNTITFKNSVFDVNMFDGIENLEDINTKILTDSIQFDYSQGEDGYLMQTPSRMNLFVDYNVLKGLYVSFLSEVSLYDQNNPHKVVGINSFQLTPRYDFKWFGFALPIAYVQNSGFHLGLGFRVGPVYVGSSNILDLFTAGAEINKFNAYMGFRIPLYKAVE